ncbi:MAG: leucine-rich repeat protein [Clostridia bacterium]|nr:leucine-rich repeat protein [Clostridia bacterium]
MKNKLLIFALLLIAMSCMLAIGISADDINPDYNEQYVKTMTQGMLSVELEDGTSVDLYDAQGYTLCYYWDDVSSATRQLLSVRTKDLTFNFNGTRLSSIYYGDEQLAGTAKAGKIVVLNIRGIKNGSGQDITDFNGDNMFKESSPLQHIFMPDTIVNLCNYAFGHRDGSLSHLRGCYFSENSQLQQINSNTFMNARQLRGFYIPNGVKFVGTNGFQGCYNAFFVNDPYDFLTKPDVYYFPSGFYKADGEAFDSLKYNLNKVLVFSADNIEITNPFAFEVVACDSKGTKPAIVFKGDVSSVSVNNWNVSGIYFANENDIDATTAGASGNKPMYFCNAEGNTSHLAEKIVDVEAKCEVDAGRATYCFCGYEMSKEAIEGTALSHNYDYINNDKAILVSMVYANFSQKGEKTVTCANCKENGILEAPALFTCIGYSAPVTGSAAISLGFTVNNEAIADYKKATGVDVKYGVFVASLEKLQDGDIFVNGVANENAICAEIKATEFSAFDIKVTGFADNQKDAMLALGAYVAVIKDGATEYSYMQADDKGEKTGNYYFVSYNNIVNNKAE